jgi:hypothetical protein
MPDGTLDRYQETDPFHFGEARKTARYLVKLRGQFRPKRATPKDSTYGSVFFAGEVLRYDEREVKLLDKNAMSHG